MAAGDSARRLAWASLACVVWPDAVPSKPASGPYPPAVSAALMIVDVAISEEATRMPKRFPVIPAAARKTR